MGDRTLSLKRPVTGYQDELTARFLPPAKKPVVDQSGPHSNRCYVLIGVPGSGKSTWCDAVVRNWKGGPLPVVICEDDLIQEECDRSGESFADVLARCDAAEQKQMMRERFHAAIGVRRDIIIDRPNLTEDDRSDLLLLLPDYYQKIGIVFTLPNLLLMQRLQTRFDETGRPFSQMVVNNMLKRLERPGRFEFDRTTSVDHSCVYLEKGDNNTCSENITLSAVMSRHQT